MVHARRLHHWLTVLRHIKVWQLIVLLVVSGMLSAYLLRQNNLQMIELRNEVKKADENNDKIPESLINLQHYVTSHMNTDLGRGVFLEHSYQRAYDKAVQEALAATNPNSKIYEAVEQECRPVFARTGSFPAYTECAREKLSVLAPSSDPMSSVKAPPAEIFTHNFSSPLVSVDAAGILVLLTVVIALLLLGRIIGYVTLRAVLKARHQ